jgi:predicted amidohydrolase
VALFQQDSDAGNVLGQLRMLAQEADRIRGRADVLVCPQLYMTGYNVGSRVLTLAEGQRGAFLTAVQRIARAAGLAIVCGYPEAADGHCYNAAVAIDAAGNKLANHRKLHLSRQGERSIFAPGDRLVLFRLGGVRTAILICYDVEFPETVRAAALAGAELILVPAALRKQYRQLAEKMIPTRAFENGLFLAYVNYAGRERDWLYCGQSAVIGPDGGEVVRAGEGPETVTARIDTAEIDRVRAALPYIADRRADYRIEDGVPRAALPAK